MAAHNGEELISELRPASIKGLTFLEVATWLVSLARPKRLFVGFSLGYDRTKWLESLPDHIVYRIVHPDLRRKARGKAKNTPKGVTAEGFLVNHLSTRFTLRRATPKGQKRAPSVTVWDLFKFFQCSFVKALRAWKIGTEAEVARIEKDKARRGSFKGIGPKEERYCQSECRLLSKLARALLEAHEDENLKLVSYYGPGSTASVILKRVKADEQIARMPPAMIKPVYQAFFGGRFEISRIGPVRQPCYAYDIASAYPYAMARLPCLHPDHGRWIKRTADAWRRRMPAVALVHYTVQPTRKPLQWGPLPHRIASGDILFPVVSAGGWAWGDEVLSAMRWHPGVKPTSAWIWEPSCACPPPFRTTIVDLYNRRCTWGKAERGIVLKLGLNSLYGKSAQRVGAARFRCMVRAGLITSMTRAMLLDALYMAGCDGSDVLELATDSVLCTKRLNLPAPSAMGTEHQDKPLGSWECKEWPHGVFLIRPGVRFALDDPDEKKTAARGIGTRVLHSNRTHILDGWERAPGADAHVQQPAMFWGAKLSVGKRPLPVGYARHELYGRWQEPSPRVLSYAAVPKRAAIHPDWTLEPWELSRAPSAASLPYGAADKSAWGDLLSELKVWEEEQPEAGLLEAL